MSPSFTIPQQWLFVPNHIQQQIVSSNCKTEDVSWQLLLPTAFGPFSKALASCKADHNIFGGWAPPSAIPVPMRVPRVLFYILERLLACFGVAWLTRRHRNRCRIIACTPTGQQQQDSIAQSKQCVQARCSCSSCRINMGSCRMPAAADTQNSSNSNTCSNSKAASPVTAVTAVSNHTDMPAAQWESVLPHTGSGDASNVCGIPQDIAAALAGILSADQVDDIYTAAAKASASIDRPFLQYRSLVSTLPVSIKLPHADHADIPVIGPLLTQTLERHVAVAAGGSSGNNSSSGYLSAAQVYSMCFPGCIQLLANIYHVEDPAALVQGCQRAPKLGHDSGGPTGIDSNSVAAASNHAEFASSLLQDVYSKLAAHAASSSHGSTGTDMHISVGGVQTSTIAADTRPYAAVVATVPAARLLCSQPSCLVAGREQQVTLTVKVAASAASAVCSAALKGDSEVAWPYRFVAFQRGMLVADKEVLLSAGSPDGVAELRVEFLSLSVGVLHVALMPGSEVAAEPAQQPDEQQQAVDKGTATQPQTAFTPLLLQLLPVLPEAAATELDAFWQQSFEPAAAAAAVQATSKDYNSNSAAAAAWQNITDLTIDFAYLLEAAAAASKGEQVKPSAAGSAGVGAGEAAVAKLPDGPRAVLLNLCRHLVLCQLWRTVAAVVEHVAAALDSGVSAAAAAGQGSLSSDTAAQTGSNTLLIECEPNTKPSKGKFNSGDSSIATSINNSKLPTQPAAAAVAPGPAAAAAARVSRWHLLCGLPNQQLESLYRATQFRTSGGVDMFRFGFCGMLSAVSWLISFCTDVNLPFASTSTAIWWGCSFIVVQLFTTLMPALVLLLRRSVAHAVQGIKCSPTLQQQQHVSGSKAGASHSQQQQEPTAATAAAETAVYIKAARTKDLLIICWLVLLELVNAGIAYKLVAVPPAFTRVYHTRTLNYDMSTIVTQAMKGAIFQVSFPLFLPILLVDGTIFALQKYNHGMNPTWWIAVRMVPGCLLAVMVAAQQNITGRRQFLQAQQKRMGSGCLPVQCATGVKMAAPAGKVRAA